MLPVCGILNIIRASFMVVKNSSMLVTANPVVTIRVHCRVRFIEGGYHPFT